MALQKLTKESLREIDGKRVIVYTMVKSYLFQIEAEFGSAFLDRIDRIIDDVPRNFGTCTLDEKHRYEVTGVEYLQGIDPEDYVILITSEYYWKKYENLKAIDAPITEQIYWYEDTDTAYYHEYLEKYKDTPLKNSIVFRSGMRVAKDYPYSDFADNAKALFDYMLREGLNEKYELIWLVGDPTQYGDYADVKNVTFMDDEWCHAKRKEERERYYEVICLSKYFFFTEHCSFVRFPREEQIRVQLWHGHGFKGRNLNEDCSFQYEYMPVAGALYKEIHRKLFHLREDQLIVTGLPKQDWIYHPVKRSAWEALGIPEAGKYIFWLPTIRTTGKGSIVDNDTLHTETGLPCVDTAEELDRLQGLLEEKQIVIVLKLHPEQEEKIGFDPQRYKNICFLKNEVLAEKRLHINQVLGYADALLSDYSSVAMDYTLLDRPIGFAVEDQGDYKEKIGFIFDLIEDWMPGEPLYTFDALFTFIESVADNDDPTKEKRRRIRNQMSEYEDDRSSERVLKAVGIL